MLNCRIPISAAGGIMLPMVSLTQSALMRSPVTSRHLTRPVCVKMFVRFFRCRMCETIVHPSLWTPTPPCSNALEASGRPPNCSVKHRVPCKAGRLRGAYPLKSSPLSLSVPPQSGSKSRPKMSCIRLVNRSLRRRPEPASPPADRTLTAQASLKLSVAKSFTQFV